MFKLSPERLNEIKNRHAETPQGKWVAPDTGFDVVSQVGDAGSGVGILVIQGEILQEHLQEISEAVSHEGFFCTIGTPEIREFIVHAHQDIPDLLAALKAAEIRVAELESAIDGWAKARKANREAGYHLNLCEAVVAQHVRNA